jgi:tripartite-type tricarboxylate transporter receptor subunit TctC
MKSLTNYLKRSSLSIALGVSLLGSGVALATTNDPSVSKFPERPISLVVAFSAGGAADVVMRQVGSGLSEILGVPVVVENRAGANGNIGASHVARSTPDGYTLLAGFPGLTSNPSIYPKMNYEPQKDLAPIKMVAAAPVLLVTYPGIEPKSVKELIAYAKEKPGAIRFGSAGIGASGHLAGELFKLTAGANLEHIPYKGGANALKDLMSGQIEVVFDSVPSSRPLVEAGKLRALAIAGDKRSDTLPDVPTFKEAGLNDYYAGTWFGVLAPAGTPAPIVSKISDALTKLLAQEKFQNELAKMGLVGDSGSTEDFVRFMAEETDKWKRVVDVANIKVQ